LKDKDPFVNEVQFTTGDLLKAVIALKAEQDKIRSNMVTLAEDIHKANAIGDAEEVQHRLDWITYDAGYADRLKARQRQVHSAIRILNRLVKTYT
jgi:hypothetical protein